MSKLEQQLQKTEEAFWKEFTKKRHDGYRVLKNSHPPDFRTFLRKHQILAVKAAKEDESDMWQEASAEDINKLLDE